MKWLLITTQGTNPGDEFARLGTMYLIRQVDHAAEFDLCNKESKSIYQPRPFDVAVICGMPLVWSLPKNECQDIGWWEPIFRGWIHQSGKPLLALGVGTIAVSKINNLQRYAAAIQEVLDKTKLFTARQPILAHPQIVDTICPSAFSLPREFPKTLDLCNLMPHGGHYMCCETQQAHADAWYSIQGAVAADLIESGFIFMAHNREELDYARRLGWPEAKTFFSADPANYLTQYSQARCYIGNRLHGAAVVAATNQRVLGIAADSRTEMVHRLGGKTITPWQLKEYLVGHRHITDLPGRVATPFEFFVERKKAIGLLKGLVSKSS